MDFLRGILYNYFILWGTSADGPRFALYGLMRLFG